MRRAHFIFIAVVIIAAGISPGWGVQLHNADFSEGVPGELPAMWQESPGAEDVFSLNDADGVGEHTCLQYAAEEPCEQCYLRQGITLNSNEEYVLSVWLKSDGTTNPAVGVKMPGSSEFAALVHSDGSGEWRRYETTFTVAESATAAVRVYGDLQAEPKSRPGSAWIDTIRITRAGAEKLGVTATAAKGETLQNLARGKEYTWSQAPSYALCTDEGDAIQLTDGEYTVGYFWTQDSTVGWSMREPLEVTIDLGEVQPISGLSFNTAAGTAGVGWPSMIFVLTSKDGEQFAYHGELISLSADNGLPAPQDYSVHRYVTDDLRAAGRYVKLLICPSSKYVFCDEIEVYEGDFPVEQAASGKPVESTEQCIADYRLDSIVGVRLGYDLQRLRRMLQDACVSGERAIDIRRELDRCERLVETMQVGDIDFWRGLPYNDLHRRIYAINADVKRGQGYPEFFAWQNNRWDLLEPMDSPTDEPATVHVPVMKGEYRSAAFNLSNYGDQRLPARIDVDIPGLPEDVVTVHEVQYVQTQERQVVSNALPVARTDDEGLPRIFIPAGITKQIWLTVHAGEDVSPGSYSGQIAVTTPGHSLEIPARIEVADITLDRPPVTAFCWDYISDNPSGAPDTWRVDRLVETLQSHFVDAPWAAGGVIPFPEDGSIDSEGHITEPMDFTALDRWIERFPKARTYCLFPNLKWDLRQQLPDGTDRWKTAYGEWARALTDHLRERSVPPERWCMLLIDEPSTDEREEKIIARARAMKAAVPELQVFEDPTRVDPSQAMPGFYEVCDILCPNPARLYRAGEDAIDLYHELTGPGTGKKLWLYQCSGPHKLLDPITYHRQQFWHAYRLVAKGAGFWGFVHARQTGSSWDNFTCAGTTYSLVYVDRYHFATSKHWEAVREGIEDYTYNSMLCRAVHKAGLTKEPRGEQAFDLVIHWTKRLSEWEPGGKHWADERDRSGPDTARRQILRELQEIRKISNETD